MLRTPIIIFLLTFLVALSACAGDINSDLLAAAKKGNTATVKSLLDAGADVNSRDRMDITALMWATSKGYTATVWVLLNKGADVRAKDKRGRAALMIAEQEGHTEIAELLKQAGATE